MNKNQFTAIFYLLYAILSVLAAILSFLCKDNKVQKYINDADTFSKAATNEFIGIK